ncbi:MAG: hypothetical protein DHS20C18_10190 [Saprospiraceae bacterium]|nr:MAG: hypothetical protein DHS20C18_10190 [Saprospiraceae bacterium]
MIGLLWTIPNLQAQCNEPLALGVNSIQTTSANISFTSAQANVDDHCWRILIGGVGFINVGQAVVDIVVCAGPNNGPDPAISITGNMVNVAVNGLAPGTAYDYYVTETCNGLMPPSNASPFAGPFGFVTFDLPFIVDWSADRPSCLGAMDGNFQLEITDGGSCMATTYDMAIISGPAGVSPTIINGATAANGPYNFTGASAGNYTIDITETGPCNPLNNPVTVTVTIEAGLDVTDPTFYLTDILGNILTNSPNSFDLGDIILPEGVCGRQDQFFVYGADNCDIFVNTPGAVTATANTTPATVSPGTQVISPATLASPGIQNLYLLDVHWSAGQSTVTVTGCDAANNCVQLSLTANIIADEDNLAIVANAINATIPVCETSTTVLFGLTITGGCDATLIGDPVVTPFGTHLSNLEQVFVDYSAGYFEYSVEVTAGAAPLNDYITIAYESALGTFESTSIGATSVQAIQNEPPVIYANAENLSLPACLATIEVRYSFTIQDDCEAIDEVAVISGFTANGANLVFCGSEVAGTNAVYFEFCGNVTPGSYPITIIYGATSVNSNLTITQEANQAAIIGMPGNLNFSIPICQTALDQVISITVSDDCDEIDHNEVTLSLGGNVLTPAYWLENGTNVYLEYPINLTTANSGQLLVASYTDEGGLNTSVDAQIVVTDQPDTWAPIIVYPAQDINMTLDPCEPEVATLNFSVAVLDNCDGVLNPIINAIPSAGITIQPQGSNGYSVTASPGNYQILLSATDAAQNTRQEDFFINIIQQDPPLVDLACNDTINLSLNTNCQAVIIPEMLLTGEWGCLTANDFDIVILDDNPANGNILDGYGYFTYQLTTIPADIFNCEGIILAEDKQKPVLDCPDDKTQASVAMDVQYLTGSLTTDDPVLELANYPCFLEFVNPSPGDHFYDLYTFTVSQDDIFTFDLATSWGGGLAALFQGTFNPAYPCENVIAQGDFNFNGNLVNLMPFDPIFRVNLPLQAGTTYTLLTSANGSVGNGLTGDYSWAIYAANGGTVSNLNVETTTFIGDLICNDLDSIRLARLPTEVPRCYQLDASGAVIYPSNSLERQRLEQLLTLLSTTGFPYSGPNAMGGLLTDNCGSVEVCVSETSQSSGLCGPTIIQRTFRAIDDSGNAISCTQEISVRKPTLEDVVLTPLTAILECDEGFPTNAAGNPHPSITGYPFLRTAFGYYNLDQDLCNLAATYEDLPLIYSCESGYKLVRKWTLTNWCNPSNIVIYNQLIKVGDFTPPEVSCPIEDYNWDGIPDPLVYSTGPFDCTAAFFVPLPEVEDNCSDWEVLTEVVSDIITETTTPQGVVLLDTQVVVLATINPGAVNRFVGDIPLGCHRFRYTVTDDCGNTTVLECDFCVEDQTAPVANCNDDLNISLGGGGIGGLTAADIDEGSWDNCGEIMALEVRRLYIVDPISCEDVPPYYSDWGPSVEFNCCDLDAAVRIELRVTDAAGNTDICWLEVTVEDKIRPMCTPPVAVTTTCNDLPYNFDPQNFEQLQSLFGIPLVTDNCSAEWQEITTTVNLDDCGVGTLIRRFRAVDQSGNVSINSCQQLITIQERHNYEIRFPADASANCGDPAEDSIEYTEIACDLLAVGIVDDTLNVSAEECYKVFRTFKVVNWCEYNGADAPVIISREEDCDGAPGDEAVWVLRRPSQTFVDRDNDELNTVPFAGEKGTTCDGATNPVGYWRTINSVGFWQYTQHIKIYDDTPPVIAFTPPNPFCSVNDQCTAEIEYRFILFEPCSPSSLEIQIFYDEFMDGVIDSNLTDDDGFSRLYPKYRINFEAPIGMHSFIVIAEDGCGNVLSAELPFEVVDCKAPAPACIFGLAVELTPLPPNTDANNDGLVDPGGATLTATSFLASTIYDCSLPLTYSINILGEQPRMNQSQIVLTCINMPSEIVEVYAWDNAYNPYSIQPDGTIGGPNYDYCETYVLVQDNMFNLCGGGADIAGRIAVENDEPLEDALVELSGATDLADETNTVGQYGFQQLQQGYDYTITPFLDEDASNGVTTFDILLMTKHILGVQLLSSPYKLIAADINNSGYISTQDAIQLRKLVLNVITAFPNNTSWRFVPKDYAFPNPQNPWQESFPEVINLNNLTAGNIPLLDFVAIKMGDLNLSAATHFQDVEDRFDQRDHFIFYTENQQLVEGKTIAVPLYAKDISSCSGFQFTMEFGPSLVLDHIDYGVLKASNVGQKYLDSGVLTFSWEAVNRTQEADNSIEEPLLVFHFKTIGSGSLQEHLALNSSITPAEAYLRETEELLLPKLEFSAPEEPCLEAALFQNWPNPFTQFTNIPIYLPQAKTIHLAVYNAKGRRLLSRTFSLLSGHHLLRLNNEELPEIGVLFYEVQVDGQSLIRKMVKF